MAGEFKAAYEFKADNVEVVIQNKGGGQFSKFLRAHPQQDGQADPNGGVGAWARFIVEKQGGNKVKIKSTKTGKYLRIKPNANNGAEDKIDIGGGGGKWTVFKAHQQGQSGHVKLESAEQGGKYLAVQKDNKIRIGNGGPWTELIFYRKAAPKPFTKPYMFQQTNTVVIQHKGNKAGKHQHFLRVDPGDNDQADDKGGKGAWAQWEADPQNGGSKVRFKSTKTGKYLRIIEGGKKIDVGGTGGKFTVFKVQKQGDGTTKFESEVFNNAYLAVGPGGKVRPGNGGPFTNLFVFRKN
eukprot:45166_1